MPRAVCPTKNMARYEWFAEKATEAGLDSLVPVIGEHSERRTLNAERLRKIMLSAAKQSLKACVPVLGDPVSVSSYLESAPREALRLMAYCDESLELSARVPLADAVREYIAARYGISAMEMTTSEIFPELEKEVGDKTVCGDLKTLFERADFVKFAKYVASEQENASAVPVAVKFVNDTYQHDIERKSGTSLHQ